MKMTARTAALAIAGLLLAGGATFILGQRDQRLVTCRNAMSHIAGAKGSHGLEHRLAPGIRVSSQAISPLLARGWEGLRCPSGGQYDPGRFTGDKGTGDVRHAPSCSVHGSLATLEAEVRRP